MKPRISYWGETVFRAMKISSTSRANPPAPMITILNIVQRSHGISYLHALQDQPRLGPGLEVDQLCVTAAAEVASLDHLEPPRGQGPLQRLFIVDKLVSPQGEGGIEHFARCFEIIIPHPRLVRPVLCISLQDVRQVDGGGPDNPASPQDAMTFSEIDLPFFQGQVLNEVFAVDEIDRRVVEREPLSDVRANVCSVEDVKVLPPWAQPVLHPAPHVHLDRIVPRPGARPFTRGGVRSEGLWP